MKKENLFKFFLIFSFFMGISVAIYMTLSRNEEEYSTKVLSRKRRYLVFPDGSSFQLVFCEQNHGYLQLGDIVWFGTTAALAWELPTDPNIYHFFINSEKKFLEGNRRQDTKHVVYYNEDGKVVAKIPYHRKFIVNPAFAKRSVDSIIESNLPKPLSKKKMHEDQLKRSSLHDLDEMSIKFHRDGRKSLYTKIETFLEGLGLRGKECVLRFLCENSKSKHKQGSFLQEIMKATFTFPRSTKPDEFHKEYDAAHSAGEDCEKLYSECEDPSRLLFHDE